MIFDFTPLPRSGSLACARLRCPMCSSTWELESESPMPHGQYRSACVNCGREGTFKTPSLDAMLVEAQPAAGGA